MKVLLGPGGARGVAAAGAWRSAGSGNPKLAPESPSAAASGTGTWVAATTTSGATWGAASVVGSPCKSVEKRLRKLGCWKALVDRCCASRSAAAALTPHIFGEDKNQKRWTKNRIWVWGKTAENFSVGLIRANSHHPCAKERTGFCSQRERAATTATVDNGELSVVSSMNEARAQVPIQIPGSQSRSQDPKISILESGS